LEDRFLMSVSVLNHFDGLNSGHYAVADTNAAAGPSHVVEVINSSIAIYDKATGNALSQTSFYNFFSPQGGGANLVFDPVVTYDNSANANRFVVAALDVNSSANTSSLLVAWSNSSDPTAGFSHRAIDLTEHDASGTAFWGDFDRLGWNADDYVFNVNMGPFPVVRGGSSARTYGRFVTLAKSSLADPNSQPFDTGDQLAQFGTAYTDMTPAVMHGAAPNGPMWLVQEAGGNMVDVVEMTNTHSTKPNFTYFCPTVDPYTAPPNAADPGGPLAVEGGFHSVEWRDNLLVTAHNVGLPNDLHDTDAHARWYEFNTSGATPTNGSQPTVTLVQQGTQKPGRGISTMYASIAIAPGDSLGMTYLESSASVPAPSGEDLSMYVTGWQPGDPLGTMEAPIRVQAGLDVLQGGSSSSPNPIGDYSATTMDPSDGTFWAANEYARKASTTIDYDNWETHIAHFKLDTTRLPAWAQQSGGTLTINGSLFGGGNQALSIDATAQGNLVVTLNNLLETLTFAPGQVTAINVNSLGSTNTITVSAETQNLSLLPAINVNGAIGPLTIHGGGNAVLTVNDQANPATGSTQYTLTSGSLTRTIASPASPSRPGVAVTTIINYDGLKTLTLNAGNNGANTIDIEGTTVPTYVNGGTATNQINLAYESQNLDNIGTFVTISGGSETVNAYDQANPHGPSAYAVYDGVSRTATGANPVGFSVSDIQGLALFTGKAANQVAVTSLPVAVASLPVATTINSGGADAITVSAYAAPTTNVLQGIVRESSQLTVNGNRGTLAIVQGGGSLQNDPLDTFADSFTVTDQTVTRVGSWHKVIKKIKDPEDPTNPKDPPPPNGMTLDVIRTDTLNYKNVKSISIQGGAINSAFNVQSTPAATPVTIHAGLQTGFRGIPIPGAANAFIVGLNGSVKNIRSQVTLIGANPNDTLLVDDSQATTQEKVTVTGTQVGAAAADQFFGAGGNLTYGSMASLTLNLSKAADDAVQLTPSAVTAFFMNGDHSEFLAGHGATLDLDLTGVTPGTSAGPGTGTWTFGNRQAVSYSNMAAVHSH
jgi:hypothetical protein